MNEYYAYLESMFMPARDASRPAMTWENYGSSWQIGHRKPLLENGISEEETKARLHYSNTFPQWTVDNQSQGNRPWRGDYGLV